MLAIIFVLVIGFFISAAIYSISPMLGLLLTGICILMALGR